MSMTWSHQELAATGSLPRLSGPPFGLAEGSSEPQGASQSNIWIVDAQGNPMRLTPYVDPTCTFPPCGDQPNQPRLSPDGSLVACIDFDPDDNASSVYVIPSDVPSDYPLQPRRIYADPGGYWIIFGSWHPSGDKLLVTSGNPGGNYGGKIVEVTYPGGVDTDLWTPDVQTPTQREAAYRPVYSPDGTKIAFLVNIDPGGGGDYTRQGLWVMDADGSNAQVIDPWVTVSNTNCGYLYSGQQLEWSHDSQWIAYVDRGFGGGPATSGTFGVWKIHPDGTGKTLLRSGDGGGGTFIAHHVGWGAWLDDDSAVIYTENSGAGWGIYVAAADGSGSTNLVPDGSGPAGGEYFETAYRLRDRIYWISQRYDNVGQIKSCALDGSDVQIYFEGVSGSPFSSTFYSGDGFEWP